jgi:hypothetical protein
VVTLDPGKLLELLVKTMPSVMLCDGSRQISLKVTGDAASMNKATGLSHVGISPFIPGSNSRLHHFIIGCSELKDTTKNIHEMFGDIYRKFKEYKISGVQIDDQFYSV